MGSGRRIHFSSESEIAARKERVDSDKKRFSAVQSLWRKAYAVRLDEVLAVLQQFRRHPEGPLTDGTQEEMLVFKALQNTVHRLTLTELAERIELLRTRGIKIEPPEHIALALRIVKTAGSKGPDKLFDTLREFNQLAPVLINQTIVRETVLSTLEHTELVQHRFDFAAMQKYFVQAREFGVNISEEEIQRMVVKHLKAGARGLRVGELETEFEAVHREKIDVHPLEQEDCIRLSLKGGTHQADIEMMLSEIAIAEERLSSLMVDQRDDDRNFKQDKNGNNIPGPAIISRLDKERLLLETLFAISGKLAEKYGHSMEYALQGPALQEFNEAREKARPILKGMSQDSSFLANLTTDLRKPYKYLRKRKEFKAD